MNIQQINEAVERAVYEKVHGWSEDDHPRADDGKFTSGSGSVEGGQAEPKNPKFVDPGQFATFEEYTDFLSDKLGRSIFGVSGGNRAKLMDNWHKAQAEKRGDDYELPDWIADMSENHSAGDVSDWAKDMIANRGFDETEVRGALEESSDLKVDPTKHDDLYSLGHYIESLDDEDERPVQRELFGRYRSLEHATQSANPALRLMAAKQMRYSLVHSGGHWRDLDRLDGIIEEAVDHGRRMATLANSEAGQAVLDHYLDEAVAVMHQLEPEREMYRKVKSRPGQKSLFDEDTVERHPAGSPEGGRFAPKGSGKKGKKDAKSSSKKRVGKKTRKPRTRKLPDGVGEDERGSAQRLFDWGSDSGGERRGADDSAGDAASRGEGTGTGGDVPETGRKRRRNTLNVMSSTDWSYKDNSFVEGGKKAKFQHNIEAIKVLNQIEAEGRDRATVDEQEVLSKFNGWGQYPQVFDPYPRPEWKAEAEQLESLLGEAQFKQEARESRDNRKSAGRATLNSHFTDPAVVDAHWKAAQRLGFKGGRFLEPSIGSGHYVGLMPEELRKNTAVTGVELDTTTARVASMLYPSVNIQNQGFEKFSAPDGFYDLAASNVPFGDYRLSERRYNRLRPYIHDHFFLKTIDKVKPGGLVMHVTSTGTMDKKNDKIRKNMAKNADLVGAFRMPSGAHGQSAGTAVVTDMLIFRKRDEHGAAPEHNPKEVLDQLKPGFTGVLTDSLGRVYHFVDGKRVPADYWTEIGSVPDPEGGEDIPVNKYFQHNPDQILGQIGWTGTLYGGHEMGVQSTGDLTEMLDAAINRLPENIMSDRQPENLDAYEPEAQPGAEDERDGNLVVDGDEVFQKVGNIRVKVDLNAKQAAIIKDAADVRSGVRDLMRADLAGEDADEMRQKLSVSYDMFVDTHGPLHSPANLRAMAQDPDLPVMLALEDWDAKTKTATKAEIFEKPTVRPHVEPTTADNVIDAYGISLAQRGNIDPDYMAQLTGLRLEDVEDEMRKSGLAFEDPSDGWTERGSYLSGDVKDKLAIARAAAEADERYKVNVEALEAVQPKDIAYDDIGVRMGSPWIPPSDVEQWLSDTIGGRPDVFKIEYSPELGQWSVDMARGEANAWLPHDHKLEVGGFKWKRVVDAALNSKTLTVWGEDSKGNRYVDVDATDAAREKVAEVKEQFAEWVWEDSDRRERLARAYNDEYNNTVPANYDGSYLDFPGMTPAWNLREPQANFVAQVISRGKGFLAHEVGIGKTAAMVASAMELRRLRLANKPAIVVPKATLDQMELDARELYPGAKILSTSGKFGATERKEWISKMATGDWDMVIMSHEQMKYLPMERDTEARFLQQELDDLDSAMEFRRAQDGKGMRSDTRQVKAMEKARMKLEARIKDVTEGKRDDALTFEQSGIDQLFVDEAHAFKNLQVNTSLKGTKGIPTAASQRALDMYMKTQWMLDNHDNRGVVFASGTPISNTMAEVYNIQRYLQPDELEKRGLKHFDSWAKAFGDSETTTEPNLAGEYKDVTRHQVPERTRADADATAGSGRADGRRLQRIQARR